MTQPSTPGPSGPANHKHEAANALEALARGEMTERQLQEAAYKAANTPVPEGPDTSGVPEATVIAIEPGPADPSVPVGGAGQVPGPVAPLPVGPFPAPRPAAKPDRTAHIHRQFVAFRKFAIPLLIAMAGLMWAICLLSMIVVFRSHAGGRRQIVALILAVLTFLVGAVMVFGWRMFRRDIAVAEARRQQAAMQAAALRQAQFPPGPAGPAAPPTGPVADSPPSV